MMNCFCGMVDRRKASSLISSRDHCQRSSPSRISDTPRAGFEPVQNLSSGFVEWSCAVVIITTPRRHNVKVRNFLQNYMVDKNAIYGFNTGRTLQSYCSLSMSAMCTQGLIYTLSLGITGWKHFICLKLCKCSQISHPSPRVESTPSKTKNQPPLAESSTTNPNHT